MKYLLDAEDAKMLAWKEQAKREGLSFAEWLRRAADGALEDGLDGKALGEGVYPSAQVAPESPSLSALLFVPASPVRLGKRSYEPDPR